MLQSSSSNCWSNLLQQNWYSKMSVWTNQDLYYI